MQKFTARHIEEEKALVKDERTVGIFRCYLCQLIKNYFGVHQSPQLSGIYCRVFIISICRLKTWMISLFLISQVEAKLSKIRDATRQFLCVLIITFILNWTDFFFLFS